MGGGFRSVFEGDEGFDYHADPMGKVGGGTRVPRDPTRTPEGMKKFNAFRAAWTDGKDLSSLFGRDIFGTKAPVAPQGPNRRPDVAKIEALLGRTGDLDLSVTEGPTGYYGARLEEALQGYQGRNGLKVDGIANPAGETIGQLASDLIGSSGAEQPGSKPPADSLPRRDPFPTTRSASPNVRVDAARGTHQTRNLLNRPGTEAPVFTPVAAKAPGEGGTNTNLGVGQGASGGGGGGWGEAHPSGGPESKSDLQRALMALWIDYENTWMAAQQRTSPYVIEFDGTYNYQRAPEEWQRYYRKYGKVYTQVFVVLLDPATGKPTVWLRNPKMRESGLLGLARVFTFNIGPMLLTRPLTAVRVGQAAAAAARPAAALRARFQVAQLLRNANKTLAATTPEKFIGPKLWGKLSPEMRRLIIPRFPYFVGRAAELQVFDKLRKAGFKVRLKYRDRAFDVILKGKATKRIYDVLTEQEIKQVMSNWLVKPAKSARPTGIDAKFASATPTRAQRLADGIMAKQGGEITAALVLRIPADKVSAADIAKSISEWLVRKNGSAKLSRRQRAAFEILVGKLQKKRLPDGTKITLGQVMGLSLLLALKIQNQALVPPPPREVLPGELEDEWIVAGGKAGLASPAPLRS